MTWYIVNHYPIVYKNRTWTIFSHVTIWCVKVTGWHERFVLCISQLFFFFKCFWGQFGDSWPILRSYNIFHMCKTTAHQDGSYLHLSMTTSNPSCFEPCLSSLMLNAGIADLTAHPYSFHWLWPYNGSNSHHSIHVPPSNFTLICRHAKETNLWICLHKKHWKLNRGLPAVPSPSVGWVRVRWTTMCRFLWTFLSIKKSEMKQIIWSKKCCYIRRMFLHLR